MDQIQTKLNNAEKFGCVNVNSSEKGQVEITFWNNPRKGFKEYMFKSCSTGEVLHKTTFRQKAEQFLYDIL